MRTPARPLDVICIAIDHLEDWQGSLRLGQLLRHMIGRRQGHKCMIAVIILPAKGACVCKCGRRDKLTEIGAPIVGVEGDPLAVWGEERIARPVRTATRAERRWRFGAGDGLRLELIERPLKQPLVDGERDTASARRHRDRRLADDVEDVVVGERNR